MAVHQYEDVLAWFGIYIYFIFDNFLLNIFSKPSFLFSGFSNQYIGIFNKNAMLLNTIRFREGFMGPRIGPVSCLSFHPERFYF